MYCRSTFVRKQTWNPVVKVWAGMQPASWYGLKWYQFQARGFYEAVIGLQYPGGGRILGAGPREESNEDANLCFDPRNACCVKEGDTLRRSHVPERAVFAQNPRSYDGMGWQLSPLDLRFLTPSDFYGRYAHLDRSSDTSHRLFTSPDATHSQSGQSTPFTPVSSLVITPCSLTLWTRRVSPSSGWLFFIPRLWSSFSGSYINSHTLVLSLDIYEFISCLCASLVVSCG